MHTDSQKERQISFPYIVVLEWMWDFDVGWKELNPWPLEFRDLYSEVEKWDTNNLNAK